MDYENGDKKYSKEKKSSNYSDNRDDDDDDCYYKVKQKYREKERDYRDKERDYRDKDRDYREKERDYREKERDYKYRDRRYKEKEFKDQDKKERTRERDRIGDRDREREKEKSYKYRDKRHHSKNRSVSPSPHKHSRSSRSRSRSRSRYHSRSRSKGRSRSRSRSRHRSSSRHRSHSRQLHSSSLQPSSKWKHYDDKRYDSSYSRSKDIPDAPFSHNKGQRKMMILEKLGIDLVVPENLEKSQTGNAQVAANSGQKSVTISGELASYCNITPANSKMIMDRLNRKKLLWTNKTAEQKPSVENKDGVNAASSVNTVWQSAIFSKDGDNKQTAKFKRLMGIKDDQIVESKPNTSTASGDDKDLIKRQEEMFQNMEMQYEVARASTHTHRGIGLGFGIHQYPR